MPPNNFAAIKAIHDFPSLVRYLRKELGWPVDEEQVDDLTFEYTPQELGLEAEAAVKIRCIKQLRPLTGNQPWGIFWIDFERKQLPVVVMRRILGALVRKQRGGRAHQAAWDLRDLLFISATGSGSERGISFAHFQETESGPQLRTFSWDAHETHFYYLENLNLKGLRWPENPADAAAWRAQWSQAFTAAHRETISTSQALASHMAGLASAIRLLVLQTMEAEQAGGPFHRLFDEFKRVLIHDLEADDFADMYAQTVTYGLFTARAMPFTSMHGTTPDLEFDLEHVADFIPPTNPFLCDLFAACIRADLDDNETMDLEGLGVGELVALLQRANMEAILQDFGRQTRGEDPVIHFYESFLREYDAEKKVKRGVFYTPDPVVSFIVRSVDQLLRTEFGCADGLATVSQPPPPLRGTSPKSDKKSLNADRSTDVGFGGGREGAFEPVILDPATGTGTFLKYVIEQVYGTFVAKHKSKGQKEIHRLWNEYVPQHLLPRLYGFELLAAPYSVAHMKLGLKLRETGYDFASDERLRVYLTNTLQWVDEVPRTETEFLAHESQEAGRVKSQVPVTVIIGNPPYSGHSANVSKNPDGTPNFIGRLMVDYKRGYPDLEKPAQAKWLQDDYVKFLRWGQWRISETGTGILAMITNHAYIDNPTFRGMREQLMRTFSKIYTLDLHGNAKKKETAPDGSKDENVFDIQQGVAICFMVKRSGVSEPTRVYRADIFGSRQKKYDELIAGRISWQEIEPQSPLYLFTAQDQRLLDEYESCMKVSEIMGENGDPAPGIVTTQDEFAISWTADEAIGKVKQLLATKNESEARKIFSLCSQSQWNYERAKKELGKGEWRKEVTQVLYRPFDIRWTVFNSNVAVHRRERATRHMLEGENLVLIFMRQVALNDVYSHFGVSRLPVDNRAFYSNKGIMSMAPLYLYPIDYGAQRDMFSSQSGTGPGGRRPNLSPQFIAEIEKKQGLKFIPDGRGDLSPRPHFDKLSAAPSLGGKGESVGTFGPEDVFHYLYAVFHSPSYRQRYAEFLKIDFPRLPLTSNRELFVQLCGLGAELVSLHLLEDQRVESRGIENSGVKFTGWAENCVAKGYPKFGNLTGLTSGATKQDARAGKGASPSEARGDLSGLGTVFINEQQGFEGVPQEVWEFHVGGYQVCEKWLKDRRGRQLSAEDIAHYQKIVVALGETIKLMARVDEVIQSAGGWPVK